LNKDNVVVGSEDCLYLNVFTPPPAEASVHHACASSDTPSEQGTTEIVSCIYCNA
jgi:hypothetical protein